MRVNQVGAFITFLVILAGVAMIAPAFTRTIRRENPPRVAIFIYVTDESSGDEWCNEVSSYLKQKGITASIFFTGRVADSQPDWVKKFEGYDIGSLTYSYIDLTTITDYSIQLAEIKNGKIAVDAAGGFDSRLFSSLNENVTNDIYSQLRRAGIVADFSYPDHYIKLNGEVYITMPLNVIEGTSITPDTTTDTLGNTPTVIKLYNNTPKQTVIQIIEDLRAKGCRFLNASEITGLELVVRGG
jgi:peptidoglycan/xylan/chitin deacetylase (PgdA/CDA1 family)